MTEETLYRILLWGFILSAVGTLPILLFITAPYGRHTRKGWGPQINATVGWVVMESPSVLAMLACFVVGSQSWNAGGIALLCLWMLHYVNRTYVFPFRRRGGSNKMPLFIAASAFTFTSINGYLQGRHLFTLSGGYGAEWLLDPRFICGAALFLFGWGVNLQSDAILRNLRKPGEKGYKIPTGGLFRYISAPNYFGEILEWTGWAIATWSLPGVAFAFWTFANLAPRALSNHRWYRETFPDYPTNRKALIPGLF